MNKRRFVAMLLTAAMCLTAFASCTPPPKEDTQDDPAVNTTDVVSGSVEDTADVTMSDVKEPSNLKPSVTVIDVVDETFEGFDDLQIKMDGGEYKDHDQRSIIETLVKEHFIISRINPADDKGEYKPDESILIIEAVAMAINAFSKDKIDINSDNWYESIKDRMIKDKYPTELLQLITGKTSVSDRDELFNELTQDKMYNKCKFKHLALILVFAFENYTQTSLGTGYKGNLTDVKIEDLEKYLTKESGSNDNHLSMSSSNLSGNSNPTRALMAKFLFVLKNNLSADYWADEYGDTTDFTEIVTSDVAEETTEDVTTEVETEKVTETETEEITTIAETAKK